MNCRRHGSKPTLALWMLVAVADLGLLATAAGSLLAVLVVVAGLVTVGGAVGMRTFARREPAQAKIATLTKSRRA